MKIVHIHFPSSGEPVFYIKPDTAVHNRELPLYIPDFTTDLRGQLVLLAKISKQGKCISERFASKYYEQVSVGLSLMAYDRWQQLQAEGLPWEEATSFDGAMIVGNFMEMSSLEKEMTIIFSKNNIPFQSIALQDILPKVPLALSMLSQRVTLRTGDLLAIPLESIFYPLEGETTWAALLQEEKLFWVEVK